MSNEEVIATALAGRDGAKIEFQPNEKPWILTQRPGNKILLFFKRRPLSRRSWRMVFFFFFSFFSFDLF